MATSEDCSACSDCNSGSMGCKEEAPQRNSGVNVNEFLNKLQLPAMGTHEQAEAVCTACGERGSGCSVDTCPVITEGHAKAVSVAVIIATAVRAKHFSIVPFLFALVEPRRVALVSALVVSRLQKVGTSEDVTMYIGALAK